MNMNMKRFTALLFFTLIPTLASASWYTECREANSGGSCKQNYNSISICCRNKYDASGPPKDLSSFMSCVQSNATHYADCEPSASLALAGDSSSDAFIATLLAVEYSKLAADLQAPSEDEAGK